MEKIIEQNLAEIKLLFTKHGAVSAYVFGSAAINKMDADSDVDFLFSFPPNTHFEKYANDYFSLLYALQDLLHKEVDLVAEETLTNPYLIQKINTQKIRIV
ncbi:nucleotidyltransferase family protein [Parasediminibacterium sp. JCM 36343]|uniref:nucleotidyltransferase family protein n=1 Tax=Parasediminibacterium sp. JCM 36343 TaxID=3374279 RepID=UPI00397942C5